MENLKGISVKSDWLYDLVKVSDLIYYEGPLLSHFQSTAGEDYLFYWVDSDELFNRWLIFNVSINKLQEYLNRKVSLLKLITDIDSGLIYKAEIDSNIKFHNVELVYIHNLPENYLPKSNSLYTFQPISLNVDLSNYSRQHNQGIFETHFDNSPKVGYGTIDAEFMANSLIQIITINKGLRKNFINQTKKQANERDIKIDLHALQCATTLEYIGNTRNSFGALFKPITNNIPFPNQLTIEDEFVQYIIGFYESSNDIETFKAYISDVDKAVVNSYKSFLKSIIAAKSRFNLNWVNAISNHKSSTEINIKNANVILHNLETLQFSESNDIKITGKFTALNLKTGHYEFEDFEDETNRSKGYLDSDRLEMAYKIKWDKTYDVIVKRKEELQAGSKDPKITDLLISFIEL